MQTNNHDEPGMTHAMRHIADVIDALEDYPDIDPSWSDWVGEYDWLIVQVRRYFLNILVQMARDYEHESLSEIFDKLENDQKKCTKCEKEN